MFKDSRIEALSKTLVHHSIKMQKGENVMIYGPVKAKQLILQLLKEIRANGGNPIVELSDDDITREMLLAQTDQALKRKYRWLEVQLEDIDCMIHIRALDSDYTNADVPSELLMNERKNILPLQSKRLGKKWVLLNYPTEGAAHKAKMSYEQYFDYLFDVMNVDYKLMEEAFNPLKELMEKTDRVKIVGPGTNLEFSIKGLNVIPCAGENNIPDGEIFTAPVKDSVNGTISYNTPSAYRGRVFNNVKLTFKGGKIIDASADDNLDVLEEIFNTDEGSRYVGEFAIGVNPKIKHPMTNTLFDEKIAGSIHFTPGNSYDHCPNGNKSSVHWDLVLIQTKEYGGGEIYFDGELIRKDGIFVKESLKGLNPENL
jgi:aminopeptidase